MFLILGGGMNLKNGGLLVLKNFAPLREIILDSNDWIGGVVVCCERFQGVKIVSRKGAKTQRKMGNLADWYVLDYQWLDKPG
jgi:hypothetical protein